MFAKEFLCHKLPSMGSGLQRGGLGVLLSFRFADQFRCSLSRSEALSRVGSVGTNQPRSRHWSFETAVDLVGEASLRAIMLMRERPAAVQPKLLGSWTPPQLGGLRLPVNVDVTEKDRVTPLMVSHCCDFEAVTAFRHPDPLIRLAP